MLYDCLHLGTLHPALFPLFFCVRVYFRPCLRFAANNGIMTTTTESCKNGAMTLSRTSFSRNVGRVTIFSWMLSTACCIVGLRLAWRLDLVSGDWWLCTRIYTNFCCHCRSAWNIGARTSHWVGSGLNIHFIRKKWTPKAMWDPNARNGQLVHGCLTPKSIPYFRQIALIFIPVCINFLSLFCVLPFGGWFGVAATASSHQQSAATSSPVSTGRGEHLLACLPIPLLSRSSRPTQPSHPSVGWCNEYRRWFRQPLGKKRQVLFFDEII